LVIDDTARGWCSISGCHAGLGRGILKEMNWLIHLLIGAGYGVVRDFFDRPFGRLYQIQMAFATIAS